MIVYPDKRIYGLIGAPRVGKDTVAQYLQESRNFVAMAFADKIKEEFGISKEDFESAKISGNINKIREELWAFSAEKRKKDPFYFIRAVINDAKHHSQSIVITDIRTADELLAVQEVGRVYWVLDTVQSAYDPDTGLIKGSKLSHDEILDKYTLVVEPTIKIIENRRSAGVFKFFKQLEQFFFLEDIMDLSDSPTDKPDPYRNKIQRRLLKEYIAQFNVVAK